HARAAQGRAAAEEPASGRAEGAATQPLVVSGRCLAAADQAGLPAPAPGRGCLEAGRPAGGRRPAGAGDHLPPRGGLPAAGRLRRLVRPDPHPDRLLPGPVRAAQRRPPRAAAWRGRVMSPDGEGSRSWPPSTGASPSAAATTAAPDTGRPNEPMQAGNATLIGYRDGRIAIVRWSGGPDVGPDVAWARQSLAPIVWNGQLNPQLNDDPNSPQWGYTPGGVTPVWRSGVGIDRRGNLIYVAADGQTVITIAEILQHAGAVRAMEFDINPEWHTLITYIHGAHGLVPTIVGPNPMQSPTRYLVPDDRDFFAV